MYSQQFRQAHFALARSGRNTTATKSSPGRAAVRPGAQHVLLMLM